MDHSQKTIEAVQLRLFQLEAECKSIKKLLFKVMVKRCSRCRETMKLEQFYRDKKYPDGYSSWCRECKIAAVKAYQRKRAA